MLSLLQDHPITKRPLFIANHFLLIADILQGIFHIYFSPPGGEKEEEAMIYFINTLQNVSS